MKSNSNKSTQKKTNKTWLLGLISFLSYIALIVIGETIYSFTLDNSVFYIVCGIVFIFLILLYLVVCYLQYKRELWILFSLSIVVLSATLILAVIHAISVRDVTGSTMAIATAPLILAGIIFILGEKSVKQKNIKDKNLL